MITFQELAIAVRFERSYQLYYSAFDDRALMVDYLASMAVTEVLP